MNENSNSVGEVNEIEGASIFQIPEENCPMSSTVVKELEEVEA